MPTEFFVEGKPIAQGSMRSYGGGRMVHSSPDLKGWRDLIGLTARPLFAAPFHKSEAITVHLVFNIERPKTVKRKKPTSYPDLDKLIRAVLDSLTGIVYEDDSQVVSITSQKQYDERPGVLVWVHP